MISVEHSMETKVATPADLLFFKMIYCFSFLTGKKRQSGAG